MLQNAHFLAKIGADTAENERYLAENLPKIGNYPAVVPVTTSKGAGPAGAGLEAGRPVGSCQFLAQFRQNFARFRLYRRRSLQVNTRFAASFKIYQIIYLKILKFGKIK